LTARKNIFKKEGKGGSLGRKTAKKKKGGAKGEGRDWEAKGFISRRREGLGQETQKKAR